MGSIDSVQPDCTVGLKGASLGNFIAIGLLIYPRAAPNRVCRQPFFTLGFYNSYFTTFANYNLLT
jgi:hypothetical protein